MSRSVASARPAIRNLNNSLYFGGSGQYATLGVKTFLDGQAWTFSTWTKLGVGGRLFSYGFNFGSNLGYLVRLATATGGNGAVYVFAGSSTITPPTQTAFLRDNWGHIAVTFDGVSAWNVYYNGALSYSVTSAIPRNADGTKSTFIGAEDASNGGIAAMTDTLLANRVYTAAEVQTLFSSGAVPAAPSLLFRYTYSEGSGATLTDSSGSGNNATITAATWRNDLPFTARTAVA